MTTIAVWKTLEDGRDVGAPAVWVLSDSRASGPVGTLTDKCTKVVRLEVRVSTREEILRRECVVAVAGSTLTAHNIIFAAQQTLSYLVGPALPTMGEIAEFLRGVTQDIVTHAGAALKERARCEVILVGNDTGTPTVFSLRPERASSDYTVHTITQFPYITGSDRALLIKAIEAETAKRSGHSQMALDQIPFIAFDRVFCGEQAAAATGGEMQIFAVGSRLTKCYRPTRWNDLTQRYEMFLLGRDTFGLKIGRCSVGISPMQANDIIEPADH